MYCETPELVSSVWKLSVVLLMRNQVTTVTFIVRIHECHGCCHQTFPACLWFPRGRILVQWDQIRRPSFMAGGAAQAAVVTLLSPGKERAVD